MSWISELSVRESKFKESLVRLEGSNMLWNSDPCASIDYSKSAIESCCKIILTDLGQLIPDKFPKLAKETARSLLQVSSTDNESTKTIIGGLTSIAHGMTEMRNSRGAVSHGRDIAETENLNSNYARFFYELSCIFCSFIVELRLQNNGLPLKRLEYSDHKDFNDYLDGEYPDYVVEDVNYTPSQILFYTDLESYKERLLEWTNESTVEESTQDAAPVTGDSNE